MRSLLYVAVVMVGAGTFMAKQADKMSAAPPSVAMASTQKNTSVTTTGVQSGRRTLSIPRDARDHNQTDARIDGQRIDLMVDTGASVIALNEKSAARFGLRPVPADYRATVSTANGTIKAARTRLAMVDVGGIIVRDVDAMVLPDEA